MLCHVALMQPFPAPHWLFRVLAATPIQSSTSLLVLRDCPYAVGARMQRRASEHG